MNIKTISRIIILITLSIGLFSQGILVASAQTPTPDDDTITLKDIGRTDILMKGPLDSAYLDFMLPAGWSISEDAQLHLNMTFFGPDTNSATNRIRPVSGFLTVKVNDTFIDTVSLDREGDYALIFTIPAEAWDTTTPNTVQSVQFHLEDAHRCEMLQIAMENGVISGMSLAVHSTSFMTLPHATVELPLDLRLLPYPFYQQTFNKNKTTLVIPSQPSQGELQAAITTASALGFLTENLLEMTFTSVDQLDPQILNAENVIFIGKPQNFPQLDQADWPAQPSGNNFNNATISPDDGVLQLAVSPLNETKAWMLVSGESDEAVIKAAQTIGSRAIRPLNQPGLAVVSEITPQSTPIYPPDVTLADLGYETITSVGFGDRYFPYWFDIPLDYNVSDGAYLDLVFSNSALINYEETGITVTINGYFIGGVRLSDRTTTTTTFRIYIPSTAFHQGSNRILLNPTLKGTTACVDIEDVWISVSNQSLLHAPLEPAPELSSEFSLTAYPRPLFPFFSNTTLVLGEDDTDGWLTALKVAYGLGNTRRGSVINPSVVFSNNLTTAMKENNDLLVVGRASKLPILQNFTSAMPAPFENDSDTATEPNNEFSFKISSSTPVGYLEIFPSPWNVRRTVLTILGNGIDGMTAAQKALIKFEQGEITSGNLAVVYGNQLIVQTIKPEKAVEQPVAAAEPTPQIIGDPETTTEPIQIDLVSVGIILLVGILILGLILWLVQKRKKPKTP